MGDVYLSPQDRLVALALARAEQLLRENRVENALEFLEGTLGAAPQSKGRELLRAIIRRSFAEQRRELQERAVRRFFESGHQDPLIQERIRLSRQAQTLSPLFDNTALEKLLKGFPRVSLRLPLLNGVFVTCMRPYHRRDRLKDPFSELIRLHKRKPLGDLLGYLLAAHIRRNTDLLSHVDLIVPVPADPERSAERGFYPVGHLARETSAYLSLPYRELLRKSVGTARSYQASLEDLRGAIALVDAKKAERVLRGQGILLIDDVIRSGQTARVCIDLLLGTGAESASVATIAHVEGYGRFSIWDEIAQE